MSSSSLPPTSSSGLKRCRGSEDITSIGVDEHDIGEHIHISKRVSKELQDIRSSLLLEKATFHDHSSQLAIKGKSTEEIFFNFCENMPLPSNFELLDTTVLDPAIANSFNILDDFLREVGNEDNDSSRGKEEEDTAAACSGGARSFGRTTATTAATSSSSFWEAIFVMQQECVPIVPPV
jgi:hypothetical protein